MREGRGIEHVEHAAIQTRRYGKPGCGKQRGRHVHQSDIGKRTPRPIPYRTG